MHAKTDPRPDPQRSAAKTHSLVLASGSIVRRRLLTSAGLSFAAITPDVDEVDLKAGMAGMAAGEIATALALAKAKKVAAGLRFSGQERSDQLVIGADQILRLDETLLDKPPDLAAAKETLRMLRGRAHQLVGAVVLIRGERLVWSHVGEMTLWMRDFSDNFLEHYLETEGDEICRSVGAYRLEGLGAQLFSRIEGDYFSILGLPLLPLLEALRAEGVLAE